MTLSRQNLLPSFRPNSLGLTPHTRQINSRRFSFMSKGCECDPELVDPGFIYGEGGVSWERVAVGPNSRKPQCTALGRAAVSERTRIIVTINRERVVNGVHVMLLVVNGGVVAVAAIFSKGAGATGIWEAIDEEPRIGVSVRLYERSFRAGSRL